MQVTHSALPGVSGRLRPGYTSSFCADRWIVVSLRNLEVQRLQSVTSSQAGIGCGSGEAGEGISKRRAGLPAEPHRLAGSLQKYSRAVWSM